MSWIATITDSLATLSTIVGSSFFSTMATVATPIPGTDEHPRFYYYEDICTQTPNGNTVVATSGGAGTGCWIQTTVNQATPDWNSATGYSQILNKPTIPAAQVNSDWAASSGVSAILNKPVLFSGAYADLTGKPTIPAAQVNSDWLANSGIAMVLNKPSFAPVATSGSYTDLSNKPTIPSAPTQNSAIRSFNSIFQVNTTRPALVIYSVQITTTASIGSGQNGDAILEIASDSGFTTNVQTVSINGNGQTYTLAVAIQGVQAVTIPLTGFIPAGYYARIRTVNNLGSPSFTFRAGQEILL